MRMFYRVPVHAVDYLLWLDSSGLRPQAPGDGVNINLRQRDAFRRLHDRSWDSRENNDAGPGCVLQYVQRQYIPGYDSHSPASG
jgi:hypothetical protein